MSSRRREDRSTSAAHPDPYKLWIPATDNYDADRRRYRSSTVPAHAHDQRPYPTYDSRYHDPRQSSRSNRHETQYTTAAPSYHQSAPGPSTSRTVHHASRPPAQYTQSGYQYQQPSSSQPSAHTQPLQAANGHPVAASSRRGYSEADTRGHTHRRAGTTPTPQSSYERVSGTEDAGKASRQYSRSAHPSTHPPAAPVNYSYLAPSAPDMPSRRPKDRDRERERDRDREAEKTSAELERDRYKEKMRAERHRERERTAEGDKYREPSRSRHHGRRKESDPEAVMYAEHRNASRASLSGREGYISSSREPVSGHRRHRTEDGTATASVRRQQPETTQNPIAAVSIHPTSETQPDGMTPQQTGEPPPAPRVMPVYLPPKAPKSQHERRMSVAAQGPQSGSDTERTSVKHRVERTQSGAAVQRSDAYATNSTRDKSNHDIPLGTREDVKKLEGKYVAQAPNVDIPLVTPDYIVPSLPADSRVGGSIVPQFVSIRAGQGPSDPHDPHFKSAAALRSDVPQETIHVYPHATSASIVKPSGNTRSHSYEVTRSQADYPGVERSRTDPHVADLPAGPRMSTHEPSRGIPTQISKSQSSARGNLDPGPESGSPAYPPGRPPSRSAQKASVTNVTPPLVSGPRPLRSASQGPHTNETLARPPSVVHNAPVAASAPSLHSGPPSPAHKSNSSPKTGHVHGPHSAHPNRNDAQVQIGTQHPWTSNHATPTQQAPSAPPPHPPPVVVPQNVPSSSQPSARPTAHANNTSQNVVEQQPPSDARFGPRQMTSQALKSSTVKASWVVQTTSAPPPKATVVPREDKYLRDHQSSAESTYGTHAQLRQVLSEDQDPYPRTASSMMKANDAMSPPTLSSSMMKASQAATPPTSSQRISPSAKAKDIQAATPRGAPAKNSPRNGLSKEAPTPERMAGQDLPQPSPKVAGAPQIAVVGATPVTRVRDLPHRVDNALLAPPFPAPTRSSRTASSSREHRSQTSHTPRQAPMVSQAQPPLQMPPPQTQRPLAYQPYPAPPAVTEEPGQFSPPPLPIPVPRGLEDSPPPPIEMRASEMVPAHLQSSKDIEVSESSPSARLEASLQPTAPPPLVTTPATSSQQFWQSGRIESKVALPVTQTTSLAVPQLDVRSPRPPDMPMVQSSTPVVNTGSGLVYQGAAKATPTPQSQPSAAPTRPRPKVTIEEVPEDSPIFSNTLSTSPIPMTPVTSRPTPVSYQPSAAHIGSTAPARSSTMDQAVPRSSPQSKVKDSPLHRTAEPATAPLVAPPMPPPAPTTTYAPSTSRVPFSAPPTQPTFPPSSQLPPTQRSTSQTVPFRPAQRSTEPAQTTSKPSATSTSTAIPATATGAYTAAHTSKSTYPPTTAVQSTSSSAPQTTTWQHHATPQVNTNASQVPPMTKPSALTSASTYAAVASHASKVTGAGVSSSALANTGGSLPSAGGALGLHVPVPSGSSDPRLPEAHSNRPPPPVSSSPTLLSSSTAPAPKSQNHEQAHAETTRSRDMSTTAARNYPTSSHPYTASARPGTSTAPSTQAQSPITTVQTSSNHHRAASLPITQASSAAAANPSSSSPTRNFSQPIPSTATSTQSVPFPSRPSPPEPSTRVPVAGHLSTPAPPRAKGLPFPLDRATSNDSDMLKTPSSIARSPPTGMGAMMQSTTIPIRTRQSSTDSKDSKKKAAGLFNFGLFRTKSGSSKLVENPVGPAPPPARASVDHQRSHTDAPPPTATHRAHPSSVPKEAKERTTTSHPATLAYGGTSFSQSKPGTKVPDPISIPPPTNYPVRDRKDSLSNIFTPFKFLTMNNKRNRTISAASLDVCDGNTATNTVIGSPAHSTISQAPLFPPIVPPPVRDPMVATSQWRDREEAARRQRKSGRIRRPGVTFDVDEEPPPSATTKSRGAKLIRRKSGRAATPGPTSR